MNVSITSKAFISRLLTNWPNSNQSVIECNDLSGFYFYPTECYGTSVENWLYWVNYIQRLLLIIAFSIRFVHTEWSGWVRRRRWSCWMAVAAQKEGVEWVIWLRFTFPWPIFCTNFSNVWSSNYWNTTLWQYRFTWSYRIFKIRHPGAISGT